MAKGEIDTRFDFVNFDRLYREFGDRLVSASKVALERAGSDVCDFLESCTPRSYTSYEYEDDFRSSWRVRTIDVRSRLGVEVHIVNVSPHAVYAELGRGPGTQPPFKAIAEWAYNRRLVDITPTDPSEDPKKVRRYKAAPLTAVGLSAGRKRSARVVHELVRRPKSAKRYSEGAEYDFSAAAERKARGLIFGIMRKIGEHGTPGYQILAKHQSEVREIAISTIKSELYWALRELEGRV